MIDDLNGYNELTWRKVLKAAEATGKTAFNFVGCWDDVECTIMYCAQTKQRMITLTMPQGRGLRSAKFPNTKGVQWFVVNNPKYATSGSITESIAIASVDAEESVFVAFSKNIFELVRENSGHSALPSLIASRVWDWLDMLSRPTSKTPSKNETVGLIGELLFLRDVLMQDKYGFSIDDAVNSWMGPIGESKDFQFSNADCWKTAIEIKTTATSEKGTLTIANYRQLDHGSNDELFLCVNEISENESGESLLEIFESMKSRIAGSQAALDRFTSFIRGLGWNEKNLIQSPADLKFILDKRTFYAVKDDFPRYTTADIRAGTIPKDYEITTSALLPHVVSEASVIQNLRVNK